MVITSIGAWSVMYSWPILQTCAGGDFFIYFSFCFFFHYNYFLYFEERDEEFYIFFSILFLLLFIFLNSFERDNYFLYFLREKYFYIKWQPSLLQRKEIRTCWKIFIGKNLGKLSFGIVRLELYKKFQYIIRI